MELAVGFVEYHASPRDQLVPEQFAVPIGLLGDERLPAQLANLEAALGTDQQSYECGVLGCEIVQALQNTLGPR